MLLRQAGDVLTIIHDDTRAYEAHMLPDTHFSMESPRNLHNPMTDSDEDGGRAL